ncbi:MULTISPECIES: MerR family transcriptional regulator [Loigolactobacillus]|uniref:MerR family transcriptional regulator n=1 Tax=Loigolactobacillus TaxID=2767889 RepID=UPI001CDCB13B|nr:MULTISPECIES: MerR family transcriptional regulator [Loigolactobacillus]
MSFDLKKSMLSMDNLIFGIGQISEMTGVSTRQLRYWEKRGYIHPLTKEDGKARQYDFKTVIAVLSIKHYLDEGYTLQAAVSKVSQYTKQASLFHRFMRRQLKGISIVDGHDALDLGYFDGTKTKKLYGVINGSETYFKLLDPDEVQDIPLG